jgi:cystathionine gamma-lyase
MAAVDAVLGTTLCPGDAVVLAADCYYTIRRLAAGWFERLGIEIRLVPTRGNAQLGALDGARLVWVETPTNPQLDICDITSMVEAAHARDITVAVDNTTATPYLQQPLALGADFVVASDAKAITGHSDLILGHVATRDEEKVNALRTWRTQHGAIAGPMEVWLAHRSLPTLPLRVARQCDSALCLAQSLAARFGRGGRPLSGSASHPGHDIARRQMRAFGTIVSFDLGTRPRARHSCVR